MKTGEEIQGKEEELICHPPLTHRFLTLTFDCHMILSVYTYTHIHTYTYIQNECVCTSPFPHLLFISSSFIESIFLLFLFSFTFLLLFLPASFLPLIGLPVNSSSHSLSHSFATLYFASSPLPPTCPPVHWVKLDAFVGEFRSGISLVCDLRSDVKFCV